MLTQLLPKDTPSFITPYREFLQAVQKKDEVTLSKLVEPSLLLPLLNKNIQTTLVNAANEGRVLTNEVDMTVGASFKRDKSIKFKRMGSHGP